MKVYRIKHKPSGLFYNEFDNSLDKEGSVIPYKPDLSIGLFMWTCDVLTTPMDEWTNIIIPESELEVKEYDLED